MKEGETAVRPAIPLYCSMSDHASALADAMLSDEALRRTARALGISPQELQARPLSAFQVSESDDPALVEVRAAHHEEERQRLAAELMAHHEALSTQAERLQRAASAGPLRTSASSASDLSVAKMEADRKLVRTLRMRRETTPASWFESQYRAAEQRQEAARERQRNVFESQRQSRQRLLDRHFGVRERNEERRQHEYVSGEMARMALQERMGRAASRKAASIEEHEGGILRQKQQHESRVLYRSSSLASLDRSLNEKVEALQRKFGEQSVHLVQMQRRRQHDAALRAERVRLQQMERHARRERGLVAKQLVGEMLREKQKHVDEKLRVFEEQKHEEMKQRRLASVRSTMQREAIIINSRGDWQSKLRYTPLPEEPQPVETSGNGMMTL